MQIINKLKYVVWSLALVLTVLSCDLEETNVDPGRPTEANVSLILPGAIAEAAANQSTEAARLDGIILQQFFGFDAQQIEFTNYLIGTSALNRLWSEGVYAGSMKSANQVIDLANENGNTHYAGIAKVVMAHELIFLTSHLGDIPYSEALQRGANVTPAYDSQEDIVNTVISLLDDAISDLSSNDASGFVPGSDDLIYGGDVAQWIKLANGLKARALMMTERRGSSMAEIIDLVGQSFESVADDAVFPWESSQTSANPLAKFAQDRSGTLVADPRFYYRLQAKGDPRLENYIAITVREGGDTLFDPFARGAGLTWAELNAPIPLMSYVELKFIHAEALARSGGSNAEVGVILQDAIASSIEIVKGVRDEDYAASRADLTGMDQEGMIERIVNEAYDAYYGIGFQQSWNNYRRTGYPDLTPNPDGINGFNPSGVIPRRYLYPESERISNSANLQAAIQRQGGQLLDVELWMFE